MKTYLFPGLKISLVLLVLVSGIYPLIVAGIAKFAPGGGDGVTVEVKGKTVGFENIGQNFTRDDYFWSRPSAAGYKADASAGSNKGPDNPDYLKDVEGRIQNFLKHNPGVSRNQIPAELVTASGSGLDPDISPLAAQVQAQRVANARHLPVEKVLGIIGAQVQQPLWGLFGPSKVNVLKLNLALDALGK